MRFILCILWILFGAYIKDNINLNSGGEFYRLVMYYTFFSVFVTFVSIISFKSKTLNSDILLRSAVVSCLIAAFWIPTIVCIWFCGFLVIWEYCSFENTKLFLTKLGNLYKKYQDNIKIVVAGMMGIVILFSAISNMFSKKEGTKLNIEQQRAFDTLYTKFYLDEHGYPETLTLDNKK